ncbi:MULTISPECIES: DUF2169 domain-containing protein [Sorangium]|uniref:DUF2169 domain-containing protein n=1 Tax=Sorangium cellulosum TaxID=56 RepID=A0A4V0NG13_SORCE|nr:MULTISPECIES: DUF2169 domain-containing protein [Sorangium]AUX31572.1 hypothetical protein SOCE836_037030 [Sorangium cellulosum]WCQ90950.1 hypothetical protein NQZ70_03665 [Sorangium sp. Soce836]
MSALPPDIVTALPGAEATAVAWRTQGQRYITIIVKASFAFTPGAAMWRTEPQEILRAEVHHGKNPARSVRFTGDLAPYLGRADVLFTGDAHAPPGAQVLSLPVRLAVFGASGCALDKRLLVRDGKPFQRMPLVYEKAVRGANGCDNPFGVDPREREAIVVDPQDPARPAGFGPIARAWPARKRLLGKNRREALEGPNAEIPAGFDWSYFQAAPPDQQIDFLRGDEWIVLENLHPAAPRLEMRLPSARGVARIEGLAASAASGGQILELRADTLRIDGAEQRCTVVWRQIVPVPGEDALADVRIAAGVAIDGEELAWPEPRPGRAGRAEASHPGKPRIGPEGTVLIEEPPDASAPACPWGADPGRTIHLSDDEIEIIDLIQGPQQTIALSEELSEAAVRAPALPFEPAPTAPAPAPARPGWPGLAPPQGDVAASSRTIALSDADEARASERPATPFFLQPTPSPRLAIDAPIPGAPWSSERPSPAPDPSAGLTTLALDDEVAPLRVEAVLPALPALGALGREPEPPAASRFFHVLRCAGDPRPSEPLPPLGEGDEVSLERCAIVAAELEERPIPRADVLKAHGLSEARWQEADRRWREAMADEVRRRERALRDRFDKAYVTAWEAVRGALSATDYARLVVATERSGVSAALGESAIRRTVWARMRRLWARRLADDPRLRSRVEAEIASLREAPRPRAQGGALSAHAL